MSGPVDVLAVMDAEIASLPEMASMASVDGVECDPAEAIARMTEARAAVAELIEATEGLIDANDAWMGPGRTDTKTATKRARDALARIQGGDA